MPIEITIQVPDTLGQQLQQLHDRLPEVLERGLRDVLAEETGPPHDERAIIAILTSQPAPEHRAARHEKPYSDHQHGLYWLAQYLNGARRRGVQRSSASE